MYVKEIFKVIISWRKRHKRKQNMIIKNILNSPLVHQFEILLVFTAPEHWNNKA